MFVSGERVLVDRRRLSFYDALTRQRKRWRTCTNALENTSSAAEILLKTEDFTKCLTVFSAPRTAALSVLGSDGSRIRTGDISMRTVMFFPGDEKSSRFYRTHHNGTGVRGYAVMAAAQPIMIRAIWHRGDGSEIVRRASSHK